MYREGGVNSLIFNGLCMVKTAFLGYFRESGVKIFWYSAVLYGYAEVVLDFFHDEGAFEGAEHGEGAEYVEQELLVVFHVGAMYAQHVVEPAGYVVTFGDFVDVHYGLAELTGCLCVEGGELYAAVHDESFVESLGIQYGDVAADVAVALEASDALVCGGGAKVDFLCQLLGGEACVLLEGSEEGDVGGVQAFAVVIFCHIACFCRLAGVLFFVVVQI